MVVPVTSVDMSTHELLVQHTSHVYAQVFIAKRSSLYIFLFSLLHSFSPRNTLFIRKLRFGVKARTSFE